MQLVRDDRNTSAGHVNESLYSESMDLNLPEEIASKVASQPPKCLPLTKMLGTVRWLVKLNNSAWISLPLAKVYKKEMR